MHQNPSHPDPDPPHGDQRLFLRLFSQHQRRLYAYIYTLIPNQADADDLLQEVSVTLWEKFDTFEPGTDYMSWAMRVAFLKVQNARRKYARSPLVLDDKVLEALSAEAASSIQDFDQRHEALGHCLEKLPQDDRELILSRYLADVTVKQLAERAAQPTQTIYRSLTRIRRALMQCIKLQLAEAQS